MIVYSFFSEALQQKFPEGHLTEKQYLEYMKTDSDAAYKSLAISLGKCIFAATDRDNSGNCFF